MESVRFSVKGMRCDGCARGLVFALRELAGVASAEARPHPGEAVVTYDPTQVSPEDLRRTIAELGYRVIA